MDNKVIITIGREYGSGGHEIGRKLAEHLAIPCYDKEILSESAKRSGFAESVFETHDETGRSSLLYSLVMGAPYGGQPLSVKLYLEQFNTIKEMAQREPCVFVGRCSDYVLQDFNNVVNVFIHAPLDARIQRVSARNQISAEEAADKIEQVDKTRAIYYWRYSNQKWGEAKNYHLSLDSSMIGIDGAVQLIERFIQMRQEEG